MINHRIALLHSNISAKAFLKIQVSFFSCSTRVSQTIKLGEDAPKYHVPNKAHENDPIKARVPGSLFYNRTLAPNFRLANEPLYTNPLINFVIGAKRFTFAFGVVGLCFSYLMAQTQLILPEFCTIMSVVAVLPFPAITWLYNPYVFKIIRVYDITKPQTLESLTTDEQLIVQRVNWSGFKVIQDLVRVDSLRVPTTKDDYEARFGFVNLISEDPETKSVKYFYVNEGFGNIKMERIWSLAERRSGVDNDMKVVIQKCKQASVTVSNEVVSKIGKGLMLLVGISTEDTKDDVEKLASKVLKLRLFEDFSGEAETKTEWAGKPWQKTVVEAQGEILSVSQFTLYANIKKGAKPDFHRAQKGHLAIELYELFLKLLRDGIGETKVQDGRFGNLMEVALVNDGPTTIVYDTKDK
ncbi:hypothetical protein CANARDRAFT_196376 [[Candida] arabinofermentans NRRL YB-2248]|uniref:D-aminoacyl-tRNA deacylase n=1 Tax=[Candida] arabinofermentans NRRL YB-2248 TaxID=983967 RepID=A0A1E4T396_9ASCO|nr:hypothetical protein CANARDRAFT_196376 [[Candida] arabinofermentans NRRL YB-2248]